MRLDEWQKFIESQFLEDAAQERLAETSAEPRPEPEALTLALDDALPDAESHADGVELSAPVLPPPAIETIIHLPMTPAPAREPNGHSPLAEAFGSLNELDIEVPAFEKYFPPSRIKPVTQEDTDRETDSSPVPAVEAVPPPAASTDPAGHAAIPDTPEPDSVTEPPSDSVGKPRKPRSRARHARNVRPENVPSGLAATELWTKIPRHLETLLSLERIEEEQETAQFSYKRPFSEKRRELIERLLDPILTLEETARLLNVCPTTVRRYTNKGILTYYRKEPERAGSVESALERETRQRRFRLSDILVFLETQQAAIEADRKAERERSRNVQASEPTDPEHEQPYDGSDQS